MLLVLAMMAAQQQQLPVVELRPGLVITRSVRIARRTYHLPARETLDSALVVIRGSNIRVDFANAPLNGFPEGYNPDDARGVAIRVEGGRNVTLTGLNVRGYKIAVLARGTQNLTIENSDLSHNWKPRLFSLVEHESLADWLSFHHNERGEWLRFGAAIYLDSVQGGAIRNVRAVQGMNALLLNRSSGLRIEHNDFSFNSGLGIGLYRSSDNAIVYNTVEYDVRGYSHGFYRRGQDSAGILMYEQSCRNIIAWNSVTHGGDGLFIWAGQTTMDSGQGGVNDNLVYGNDFSWAPTNGMEATFSRNTFALNLVEGSDYGLWGGYSFGSRIVANRFVKNRVGIAIEHGQDNAIRQNRFEGDTTAIYLWANAIEPGDWGYPRFRDTRGRDYAVVDNVFLGNRVALRALNHSGMTVTGNILAGVDSVSVLRDTSAFRWDGNHAGRFEDSIPTPPGAPEGRVVAPDSLGGSLARPVSPLARLDRSSIIVDEWGPYDWKSPKLWPIDSTRAVPLRLRILGPPGRWSVARSRGVAVLGATSGRVGDTVTVAPGTASGADWDLDLEYVGEATVSPYGARDPAGQRLWFSYGRFEPAAQWAVRFFAWDSTTAPERAGAFAALLRGTPLLTRTEPRLDYMWYRPAFRELPQERFALEATTTVTLPRGEYTLRTISDDGVRAWVDGTLVIDNWSSHESAVDHAPLAPGRHDLRVQYYQKDGWVELRLDIVRGTERSAGSPGPH